MAENKNRNGRLSKMLNFENILIAVIIVLTAWNSYTITVINHQVKSLQLQIDSALNRLKKTGGVIYHSRESSNDLEHQEHL
jgi:hypothetical protein